MTPQSFEKQLEYLCSHYEIIDLEILANYLHTGKTLPSKAVIITFDDGFKDNYLYAYPLLRKYGCPATIFLTVDAIGTKRVPLYSQIIWLFSYLSSNFNKIEIPAVGILHLGSLTGKAMAITKVNKKLRELSPKQREIFLKELLKYTNFEFPESVLDSEVYLSWADIREMKNDKITFGSHSLTHPFLPLLSLNEARWEINYSKKRIEEEIGQRVVTFSYPFGGYNTRIMEIVRNSGYLCAVTNIPTVVTLKANPYKLGRFGVAENFDKFKVGFSGIIQDFKTLLKLLKGG
jgi:peptidoglycan/xylan/chitin deacetylase (PgdA/CDA1 family)